MTKQRKITLQKEMLREELGRGGGGRERDPGKIFPLLDNLFPILSGLLPKWMVCCLDLCPQDFFFFLKTEKRKVDGRETESSAQELLSVRRWGFLQWNCSGMFWCHWALQPGRIMSLQTLWKWVWTPRSLLQLFFLAPHVLGFLPPFASLSWAIIREWRQLISSTNGAPTIVSYPAKVSDS